MARCPLGNPRCTIASQSQSGPSCPMRFLACPFNWRFASSYPRSEFKQELESWSNDYLPSAINALESDQILAGSLRQLKSDIDSDAVVPD